MRHAFGTGTGRDLRGWPVLLLLLTVVVVPTACLLWFMTEAIDNERLAVRQVLAEAYRGQLVRLRALLESRWQTTAEQLDRAADGRPARAAFAACVRQGLADSAVYLDADGRPVYPVPPPLPADEPTESSSDTTPWAEASRLEHVAQKPAEAAQAYGAIAQEAADTNTAARALVAQARCLAVAGRRDDAVAILADTLAAERFGQAVSTGGRLIVADAELRALELLADSRAARFSQVAERLSRRLADYDNGPLGAPQRRFLLQELWRLAGGPRPEFLDAEDLAARLLETGRPAAGTPGLQPSGLPGVWQFASASARVVALYRTETVERQVRAAIAEQDLPTGVSIELLPPGQVAEEDRFLHVLPAGAHAPGWQLALAWGDEGPVSLTANTKVAAYLWTGLLAIVAAAVLALWIALALRRQMRLTRLKNDLVATVSHEMKTPLSSIRLLVDTLLDDSSRPVSQMDPATAREYLELIAKENARLTRVIDNFLAFSRMERNRQTFAFAEIAPGEIVRAAADAVRARFEQSACRFEVLVDPDLPALTADADALTTALVNLLDNAYKYTDDEKQITLRAYAEDGKVCFAVADNGIGLSRAACKKVFQRFYQVDRHLSRSRGGCGLGLSIVEFIVRGHGGTVQVRSQPGQGSTFTITLPGAMDQQGSTHA